MAEENLCTLFVLGDRGAGKTSLIRTFIRLSRMYKGDESTNSLSNDWIIRFKDQKIYVEIKEFSEIKDTIFMKETFRKNQKIILNIVINISRRNFSETKDSHWLEYVKRLNISPKIIVIVTLNAFNINHPENTISILKKQYPFVRYWLDLPIFTKEDSRLGYPYFLRQIIVNKFTNSLDYVREIIASNLKQKLKTLDIGNCCLTSIYEIEELFECSHLESLILSNEWGEFEKGEWKREQSINKIGPNVIYDIPHEIQKLKNLKVLICGGDWKSKRKTNITQWHIKDISALAGLRELSSLNVSNNRIIELGNIQNLKNLTKLHINNNNITQFPPIANLHYLIEINLSNNLLTSVSFLKNAKQLRTIDIHSNKIKDLSPIRSLIEKLDIKDSKWELNTISVLNNPLDNPKTSVIRGGKKSVLAYFNKSEAEIKINLKPFKNQDIKLILVGNSNAGKSTLIKWLKTGKIDKTISTTHWMTIEPWSAKHNNKKYNVRMFDFGGQEYYHDTHHLFFTDRTSYVILWEEKTNHFGETEIEQLQLDKSKQSITVQTFPLEYWLASILFHIKRRKITLAEKNIDKIQDERDAGINEVEIKKDDFIQPENNLSKKNGDNVSSFANDKNILIVQNKVDSQSDKRFLNENHLRNVYPMIYDFSSISVVKKRGLDGFKDQLFDIFNSLDIVNQNYLGTWGFIKEKIESTRFLKSYSLREFRNFCNRTIKQIPLISGKQSNQVKGILFTEQDTQIFAEYLADIGLILYYPEDAFLKDKVFLNQKKILEKVYSILLDINKENGEFDKNAITKTFKKKNVARDISDIINLMIRFKIVFEHPIKPNSYIAPLYLPKEPRKSIIIFLSLFEKPLYRFQYESFIHKSIILEFFQLYGKQVFKETNNDNLYYYWRSGIVLKDEVSEEIIMVKFHPGNNQGQNSFIDVYPIKNNSEGAFLKQIIKDLDRINEGLGAKKSVTANGKDFVPIEEILKNENDDNWVFLYEKKYYKLIDFKKYLNTSGKMKKIFISYSKQDFHLVSKFIEHLSALQLDGKVSHWYCSELLAGSDWNDEIQKHLDEADIICFMISPNFMKTKYIHEHEIAKAFEKKEKNQEFKIVPIILDFCKWNTSKNDLSKFTALPYTAKPVVDFDNQNMAWYIVEECLRIMIDKNINPEGDAFYTDQALPSDLQKIYTRIIGGKVDKNTH